MARITTPFILILFASTTIADVVTLHDGTRLEGNVKRMGQGWQVVGEDGTVVEVAGTRVKSIEVTPAQSDQSLRAANRLASLQRTVENLQNIDQIIQRYERFIETSGMDEAIDEAKKDLEMWRQRREQGMVKLGKQWVTPQRRLELIAESLTLAHQARERMRQNRLSEAETLLREALSINPENATALYLRGVLMHQQEKLVPARESFEQVRQILPEHAPSLNNLAVIAGRQNRMIASLSLLHQAMQVSKLSATILDNIAEALEAVGHEQRRNPVVQRLSRAFAEQDAQLQAVMAKQGLYRWGAVWVDRAQIERLREAEQAMRSKLDQMSKEFDEAVGRIADIDDSIRETERTMRRIEAESYIRDIEGRIWRTPYPPIYRELERDLRDLGAERRQLERRLEALRESARRVKQELPVPQYTGQMRMIGIEGAPLMIPSEMPMELLPPEMAAATGREPVTGREPALGSAESRAPTTQRAEPAVEKAPAVSVPLVPPADPSYPDASGDAFAPIEWDQPGASQELSPPDPASVPR